MSYFQRYKHYILSFSIAKEKELLKRIKKGDPQAEKEWQTFRASPKMAKQKLVYDLIKQGRLSKDSLLPPPYKPLSASNAYFEKYWWRKEKPETSSEDYMEHFYELQKFRGTVYPEEHTPIKRFVSNNQQAVIETYEAVRIIASAAAISQFQASQAKSQDAAQIGAESGETGAEGVGRTFPKNPSDFNPEGLIKNEYSNGKIVKWQEPTTGKAVYEWNADAVYGDHFHFTPDGKTRFIHPDTGNTHIKPGDSVPKLGGK